MLETKKRETAFKIKIGDLLRANKIYEHVNYQSDIQINPRLLCVELGNKKIVRVNIIANVIDKFESEGETRFATMTLDDGSGQIKSRAFREDLEKLRDIIQGDTILIIGLLRSFNQELYIIPEIVKKQDPRYLLVRKLELERSQKKLPADNKKEIKALRDEIIDKVKNAEQYEGIDKEQIIMMFKNIKPSLITQEIIKLLEDGIIYEPRPGRVRYLG